MTKEKGKYIVPTMAIAILVCLAAFMAAVMISNHIQTNVAASVKHKSAKSTTATVVSITELRVDNVEGANDSIPYKICFTIDDLNQIGSDLRKGYELAEAQRLARSGPRCKTTSVGGLAARLTKGNKLEVVYLLENQYQIDVVRIAAFGKDI